MIDRISFPRGNEKKFNKWLVEQYFKYGSVEEVLRKHRYGLPISHAGYHRVLDRWGIVKTAGPNSKLTDILNFMVRMAEEKIPLERLYKKMPPSFKPSAVTLYRVLAYIKEGLTRRVGTAVILTPAGNDKKILIARDISTPRNRLGKIFGTKTIPMGFSKINEIRKDAVTRILQQEVFTRQSIDEKFPHNVAPEKLKPFLFLDIADVRVEVFHIKLPKKLASVRSFSSYKLEKYKFVEISQLLSNKSKRGKYRVGVIDALDCYKHYLDLKARNIKTNPLQKKASLNYTLAEVSEEVY